MNIGLIISIISCAISILGFLGVSGFIAHKQKKMLDRREEQAKKIAEFDKNEQTKELKLVIKEEIEPLKDDMKEIQNKLDKTAWGVVAGLRNDIIQCCNRCVQKGYTTTKERANFHDMVDAYHGLGGNSYITEVAERFDAIPHDKKGE